MDEQKPIAGYARVAVEAARLSVEEMDPIKAWEARAVDVFAGRPAAIVKGCPKSAFLGLASAGMIKGVPSGVYSRSVDNRRYAEGAVQLLFEDASWATRPTTLWSTVAEQAASKRHNGQMDVVLALWQAGLLQTP